jgi:AcrR family transcriptional regulator
MRIVKNPDERRKEIMETSAQFFLTKGYEETSINTIVEHLKIAKGTFYHYFKSKEEILGAILEDYLEAFAEKIREITNSSIMNAHEKMLYVLKNIFSGSEEPKYLTKHVEDNKDAKLHQMLDEKFNEKFCPILTAIVRQGVNEGIYQVEYPEEITEILLMGIRAYIHIHMPRFGDTAYAVKKLKALEELFYKALGIKEDKYKIILF